MPRTKGDKPSTSSIFKKIFAEQPELLTVPSLDPVMDLYKQEHPNADITSRLRQIAANIKSTIKRQNRLGANGTGRKKRGRPKGSGRKAAVTTSVAMPAPRGGGGSLERLEDRIDECVAMAKEIDHRGLIDVIRLLRRALNGVVVRIEES